MKSEVNQSLASPADILFSFMGPPEETFDTGAVLEFTDIPETELRERLTKGMARAITRYPRSTWTLSGKLWQDVAHAPPLSIGGPSTGSADTFFNEPMPFNQPLLREFLQPGRTPEASYLLVRMHHALGDGVSALLFLDHQLRVAFDLPPEPPRAQKITERRHRAPVSRSRYATTGAPDPIFTAPGRTWDGGRFHTLATLDAPPLRSLARQMNTSYNDVLLTLVLEVLQGWNRSHRAPAHLGVFLPVNIRTSKWAGFGNGVGRIRLYSDDQEGRTFRDHCRQIHEQVTWGLLNGEWYTPVPWFAEWVPLWIFRTVVNRSLRNPSVDRGSFVFSHIEQLGPEPWEGLFPKLESIQVIPPLTPRYPLAVGVCTYRDKARISLTYHAAAFGPDDPRQLAVALESRARALTEEGT